MSAYELRIEIAQVVSCPEAETVSESSRDVLQSIWEDVATDLTRIIAAMGLPPDRVDDVTQDVYLAAWQKAPAQLTDQELRRWLIRVATNRCRLEYRRRQRWQTVWERLTKIWMRNGARLIDQGELQEERCLIQRALGALEWESRTVLVLRYFENLDSKEIGAILDIPDSTVRSHLRRGRLTLARALKKNGYEHDEQ